MPKGELTVSPVSQSLPRLNATEDMTDWQRRALGARLLILGWIEETAIETGKDTAIRRIVELSKVTPSPLPDEVIAAIPLANAKSGNAGKRTLSRATIYRWIKAKKSSDGKLAPDYSAKVDLTIPEWAEPFLELYRRPSKPTISSALTELKKNSVPGDQLPSYDQARLFLSKLSEVDKNRGRKGAQELKSLKAFTRRDTKDLWPGAVFTADGHTFKASIEHPLHGNPFRPEITAVLDVYTRYLVGWSVSLSENAVGVLEALSNSMVENADGRKVCVPAIFYTDNGGGFKNKMLEDNALGFCARWGVSSKHSIAYNSQARGIIERFQQFWVSAAKALDTYDARDMDKEALRKRNRLLEKDLKAGKNPAFLLTWEEFQNFLQAYADDYNQREHSGLERFRDPLTKRYRHLSPLDAWEQWEREGGKAITIPVEDAADLWRPYERRKVARCEVRIFNNVYFSPDLEPYHGDDVSVGYDIHDGRRVWVRDFEGRLLAVAELDGNSVPYFRAETVAEATSYRAKMHDRRISNRLKRADEKKAEIRAEAGDYSAHAIEHKPAPTIDIETQSKGEEAFAKLQEMHAQTKAAGDERPVFSDDLALARWVAEHPDRATEEDKTRLQKSFRKPGFEQSLRLAGVAVTTLKEVAA